MKRPGSHATASSRVSHARTSLFSVLIAGLLLGAGGGSAQEYLWSQRFGDTQSDAALDIALDGSGNLYVVGFYTGTVDFGTGPLRRSLGRYDGFLAKFDVNGIPIWSRAFGGVGWDEVAGVAVDSSGNVLIAGLFEDTVSFGGTSLVSAGGSDAFMAKFDANGNPLWSRRFGASGTREWATDVAITPGNGILIAGSFVDSTISGNGGDPGLLVCLAKCDPDGGLLWGRRFGAGEYNTIQAVDVDASGNIVATGWVNDSTGVGGEPFPPGRFVAKYDAGGTHLWSEAGVGGGSVCVDAAGAIYALNTNVDGNGTVVVTKYTPDGARIWQGHDDAVGYFYEGGVDTDARGNVYVTGDLAVANRPSIYLARYDMDGNRQWSRRFGNGGSDGSHGLCSDDAGNVYVAGWFDGTVDFGGGPMTSVGRFDIFVAMFEDTTPVAPGPRPEVYDTVLMQNSPNPFNPSTTIRFTLERPENVMLSIYNVRGSRVTTLANGRRGSGPHDVTWDGTDASGTPVSSGVYFYRLETESSRLSKRMVLVK